MIETPAGSPEGFAIINKPTGITSHSLLAKLSRQLGVKVKVGHAGTLDSFASGVLVCMFGRYTRLSDYFMATRKRYTATLQFGMETDTLDPGGTPVRHAAIPDRAAVEACLSQFSGPIQQIPPVYSAIHVEGKRAYRLAMQGTVPEMAARPVVIHSLQLVSWDETSAVLDVACSKGTYIRSLARDIGMASGSAAHLGALCRTASGPFLIQDACSLEEFSITKLRKFDVSLARSLDMSIIKLEHNQARAFSHGKPLAQIDSFDKLLSIPDSAAVAVFSAEDEFLGVLRYLDGRWMYAFVFSEAR
ncbi:MAG: tRNA pseudouridine(55) synthase TruB [Spirochaetes bacterium]|nr:tRNA pseudouridine(55) synthase TruB [Spirochaetota bacterium]